MKQGFWFLCAIIVAALIGGSLASVSAQVSTPTPDPFAVQLTSSPVSTFTSLSSDISADGRFVVFTSNGNVATVNPNNADGNREIFLFDYAQRRIYQITNTRNVLSIRDLINATLRVVKQEYLSIAVGVVWIYCRDVAI